MAGGKEIKRRIKSVKNTKKITKAMELVAASKMRKAVSNTLSSRPYATYAEEIVKDIVSKTSEILKNHSLLKEHQSDKKLILLITSNRGLCGAYNAQILRNMIDLMKNKDDNVSYDFVVVGKKGEGAIRRLNLPVVASFSNLPESISYSNTLPIANFIIEEFEQGKYSEVVALYTDFVSALIQKPNVKKILPFNFSYKQEPETLNQGIKDTFTFEPNINFIFNTLIHKIFRIEIFQMILESVASEQSSRMVAMKNASEAAGEMIEDLTLVYNKARQASITKEISEISAGMASVS
jgi:F-type H+-transporting ATPase subunit gamma